MNYYFISRIKRINNNVLFFFFKLFAIHLQSIESFSNLLDIFWGLHAIIS